MRTLFEDWLGKHMKIWISAFNASPRWSLVNVGNQRFPVTAGIPYGCVNVCAFSADTDCYLVASLGAYQYRMNERMVRLDLYRPRDDSNTTSTDVMLKSIKDEFADLLQGDARFSEIYFAGLLVLEKYEMVGRFMGRND